MEMVSMGVYGGRRTRPPVSRTARKRDGDPGAGTGKGRRRWEKMVWGSKCGESGGTMIARGRPRFGRIKLSLRRPPLRSYPTFGPSCRLR